MKLRHIGMLLLAAGTLVTSASAADLKDYCAYSACIPSDAQPTVVRGIPFLKTSFWNTKTEGDKLAIGSLNVRARSLFILGCTNLPDESTEPWGGGNDFGNFFIGDQAGSIKITYASGVTDTIPLIYGYSIWWRNPYNSCPMPFKTDPKVAALLRKALFIGNGVEGADNLYFMSIALRSEAVQSVSFEDNPAKSGHFVVDGLTFSGVHGNPSGEWKSVAGGAIDKPTSAWLKTHTIKSADSYPNSAKRAVAAFGRALYTYPDQINYKAIKAAKPDITAANYPGPKVTFSGTPEAMLMTNIYYENSNVLLSRVEDDGSVHESAYKAPNFWGFGGCSPDLGAFYTSSYTRLRALTLLSNAGFDLKVEKAINYFDKWLMHFPRSFPEVQLGGKPVPGHCPVVANVPHLYFDTLKDLGWPTKYKTRDFGNGENDGHGMLMISRWRAWSKTGRSPQWVKKHWEALNEAAEYIPWCLDNPELSFSEHGLLYSESEGGMMIASMFCDINCYLGLLGYAEMADAAGQPEKAKRWREQAQRLLTAMDPYYPMKHEQYGDVWDPAKNGGWAYQHCTLSPVVIGMDYWGFDVINQLPQGWADRTRRTYKMQLPKNKPEWCATAGIGYGQCYITQSALLLDEMSDARNLLDWTARIIFAPSWPNSYRVSESVVMAPDKSHWRRSGDLGNLYQLAEVVYTTHVILGIDDIRPNELKLMPRIPTGWTSNEVKDWPVQTISSGKSELVKLSMDLTRDKACNKFDLKINADKTIDTCRVRMGPFPSNSEALKVKVDGKPIEVSLFTSGDSKWAWVDLKSISSSTVSAYVLK